MAEHQTESGKLQSRWHDVMQGLGISQGILHDLTKWWLEGLQDVTLSQIRQLHVGGRQGVHTPTLTEFLGCVPPL
jgi:hypothetical protein